MSKTNYPPAVSRYVLMMRILGAMYAVGAVSFFFAPSLIFWILNLLPRMFRGIESIPPSAEYFWLPLATSMMVMLTILAFSAAASPQTKILAWVQIASKLCSSLGYLYFFIVDVHYFAYLAGFITDFPIFLIVLYMSLKAFRALKQTESTPASLP
ncbi:MAG TPA: hypothetical protein PLI09_01960 [Candidatus Hydrogenedentes bacterium]|nr:hypothetical protein [Candidatus Hydrogenedentota bacterium]